MRYRRLSMIVNKHLVSALALAGIALGVLRAEARIHMPRIRINRSA